MKKYISIILIVVCFGYAANAQIKMPKKVQQQVTQKTEPIKQQALVGKDLMTVMQAFNMRDSIGKSTKGYLPEVAKGVLFTILKLPNGQKAAFNQNKLAAILPQ